MKTLIQKIHVEDDYSFACRIYRTPHFETNWHKHEEIEIIVITEGFGTLLVGDFVGEYKTGDVYFISGNLPHWFRKNQPQMIGSAVVVHFKKDILGEDFLKNPELSAVSSLLKKDQGIMLAKRTKAIVGQLLKNMHEEKGYVRMSLLLDILNHISICKQPYVLTQNFNAGSGNIDPTIEKVIDYSFKQYLHPVTLKEVAEIAEMSIPAFCRFFRKNIKKTYFEFLRELRINHACKLLNNTGKPILEISYESGYNSWAHFSKQFKEVKQMVPSKYRKEFSGN